jgi:hypothetical protein
MIIKVLPFLTSFIHLYFLLTQLPNKQIQRLCNNEADVDVRSKVWACGRSLAGVAGSKPAIGMCVFLLSLLCVCR